MRKLFGAIVAAAAIATLLSSPAYAQRPGYTWQGGYLGVNAYNYVNQEGVSGPAMDFIKKANDGKYRTNSYLQPWTNLTLGTEAMRRCLEAGKELTGQNLKAALNARKTRNPKASRPSTPVSVATCSHTLCTSSHFSLRPGG